jgi:hypothetical protein
MNDKSAAEFVAFARQVATEEATWADWQNRVFGTEGKFVELFPTEPERAEFVESTCFLQVEEISKQLRAGVPIEEYTVPVTTASGKFVVRIPSSIHAALVAEARMEGVSLNQLVLTKLSISLCAASKKLVNEATPCTNANRIQYLSGL